MAVPKLRAKSVPKLRAKSAYARFDDPPPRVAMENEENVRSGVTYTRWLRDTPDVTRSSAIERNRVGECENAQIPTTDVDETRRRIGLASSSGVAPLIRDGTPRANVKPTSLVRTCDPPPAITARTEIRRDSAIDVYID